MFCEKPGIRKRWFRRWKGIRTPQSKAEHCRAHQNTAEPHIAVESKQKISPVNENSAQHLSQLHSTTKTRLPRSKDQPCEWELCTALL